MKAHAKTIVLIVLVLIGIFALNWAIAAAYSGPAFYLYAAVNGLIIAVILYLVLKSYR